MKHIFLFISFLTIILVGCKKQSQAPIVGTWTIAKGEIVQAKNIKGELDKNIRDFLNKNIGTIYKQYDLKTPNFRLEVMPEGVLFVYWLENGQWVPYNDNQTYFASWKETNGAISLQYRKRGDSRFYEDTYSYQIQGSELLLTQEIEYKKDWIIEDFGTTPKELDSIKSYTVVFSYTR